METAAVDVGQSPAVELMLSEASSSRRNHLMSWACLTGGTILATAIGSESIGMAWGWLSVALVLQGIAMRIYDMLWRIWVETVPPDELRRRLRMLS